MHRLVHQINNFGAGRLRLFLIALASIAFGVFSPASADGMAIPGVNAKLCQRTFIALAAPNALAAQILRVFAADSCVLAADSWGATKMPDYRAYILGSEGYRFLRVAEFLRDHTDDTTALLAAKKLIAGHDVELWDGGRLVARLDHRDGNPSDDFSRLTETPKLINETIAQPAKIGGKE
jgi:hypothetical protein